jgi:3-methylcrotonyl-CoA carboxylase alpha subunit
MKKILIANRGEIANRIIKSCKILGHKSVAVYSDADKNSKHVRLSDESYYIGPSKAQESYLSYNKILEIATKSNVDAIHPGFGFLSENDTFAQEVINRGITWIGPKPKSIKSMGNKDIARELALNSNIPICPGINNVHKLSDEQLKTKCEAIGYPLLVKSSAGGGGIGMSVVQNFKDLASAIEKTSNLAAKSFGNGDIFIEKFITNARHIEIQVFGFGAKGSVHLFERDCSMQRRYQKIIEESPAPEVDRELINNMAQAAVKLSSDVNYEGAGTVEFIYDVQEMKYYFLEMNTRIQVEHPVTELVTNNDLISMQINFAFNRKNKFLKQEKISIYGHSIECRVYAEDPSKNFLPSPGKISKLTFPKVPNGIRLDWGYDENDDVSFYYDPMIGKIISHDLVREDAVSKLINFLEKIVLKGIKTNIPFLISLLKDKNFINGTHNTKYIENNLNTLTSEINSDKNTLSEVAIDKKRIKIVETDKLKIVNNRSDTETGGIKVVYFD